MERPAGSQEVLPVLVSDRDIAARAYTDLTEYVDAFATSGVLPGVAAESGFPDTPSYQTALFVSGVTELLRTATRVPSNYHDMPPALKDDHNPLYEALGVADNHDMFCVVVQNESDAELHERVLGYVEKRTEIAVTIDDRAAVRHVAQERAVAVRRQMLSVYAQHGLLTPQERDNLGIPTVARESNTVDPRTAPNGCVPGFTAITPKTSEQVYAIAASRAWDARSASSCGREVAAARMNSAVVIGMPRATVEAKIDSRYGYGKDGDSIGLNQSVGPDAFSVVIAGGQNVQLAQGVFAGADVTVLEASKGEMQLQPKTDPIGVYDFPAAMQAAIQEYGPMVFVVASLPEDPYPEAIEAKPLLERSYYDGPTISSPEERRALKTKLDSMIAELPDKVPYYHGLTGLEFDQVPKRPTNKLQAFLKAMTPGIDAISLRYDQEGSFAPSSSIDCLSDEVRTKRFLQAIEATVQQLEASTPEDELIEICDAGTGAIPIMAIYAALCSDRVRCTALELNPASAKLAQELVNALGLADRITVIETNAITYKPDKMFHALISETMNSGLIDEPIVDILGNLKPYVKEGGKVLPSAIHVLAALRYPRVEPIGYSRIGDCIAPVFDDQELRWWPIVKYLPGDNLSKIECVFSTEGLPAGDYSVGTSCIVELGVDMSGEKMYILNGQSLITAGRFPIEPDGSVGVRRVPSGGMIGVSYPPGGDIQLFAPAEQQGR